MLVFALYTVALKPASGGGGGSHGKGAFSSAIAKAKAVQGVVNGASARDGGTPAPTATTSTSTTKTPTTTTGTPASQAPAASSSGATTAHGATAGQVPPSSRTQASAHATSAMSASARFHSAQVALEQHKVLALLFYNPAAPDDQAVKSELSAIPTHGGAVVRLAVPLQQLSAYTGLLTQVPVDYSPTLVLINRHRQAEEIAGYASTFELDQRVAEALRS